LILVDTSAWIEFLRGTNSTIDKRVESLVAERENLATTDVVVMELLAGARSDDHGERLKSLLYRCPFFPVRDLGTYEYAAELYRRCRQGGITVTSQLDYVIAAVAIREGIPVLHRDGDFDLLARHTPLDTVAS
jgi:predicted nucleic acid-binding protein